MIKRREAREWALQILFQLDLNPGNEEREPDEVFAEFWDGQLRLRSAGEDAAPIPANIKRFTENLVRGVMQHRREIDAMLAARMDNWDLDRLGNIERNVLRMGICELVFSKEKTPPPVVINEAVDICKYFGTRESGRFVNGILDSIAKQHRNESN